MDMQAARAIIDANAEMLERFTTMYLLDNGVGVQLVEAVARELFGQQVVVGVTVTDDVAKSPKELVSTAMRDIVNVGIFGDVTYDVEKLLDGAASLDFLVRYARKVNPAVIPPEMIPSDEIVAAALSIFNSKRLTTTA
jgi:hypothetical protein